VIVYAASLQDRGGARLVLEKLKSLFAALKVIFADGGYAGKLVQWAEELKAFVLRIIKNKSISATSSLACLPRRLCFAAYALRKIPAVTFIVVFVYPYSLRNCTSSIFFITSSYFVFIFYISISTHLNITLIPEEVY
jgi:hypothetical protein